MSIWTTALIRKYHSQTLSCFPRNLINSDQFRLIEKTPCLLKRKQQQKNNNNKNQSFILNYPQYPHPIKNRLKIKIYLGNSYA